jgi:hypothetical protein
MHQRHSESHLAIIKLGEADFGAQLQSYRRRAANPTPPHQAATANSDAMKVRCAPMSLAGITEPRERGNSTMPKGGVDNPIIYRLRRAHNVSARRLVNLPHYAKTWDQPKVVFALRLWVT